MTHLHSRGIVGTRLVTTYMPYVDPGVAMVLKRGQCPYKRTERPLAVTPSQTSQDNRIWVWEVATQKVIGRLEGHKALVV